MAVVLATTMICFCIQPAICPVSQPHLRSHYPVDEFSGTKTVLQRENKFNFHLVPPTSALRSCDLTGNVKWNSVSATSLKAPIPEKTPSAENKSEMHDGDKAGSIVASKTDHLNVRTPRRSEKAFASDSTVSGCPHCHRRHLLATLGAFLSLSPDKNVHASVRCDDPLKVLESIYPSRPEWYQELFAISMNKGMQSYEAQISGYKARLFKHVDQKVHRILELGIGTGPNIKYYARKPNVNVVGVDPNTHMEKYARSAASAAGLKDSQFQFLLAVGEALPLMDSSFDAVVCTLVLCSVRDIATTLEEIHRVLKPGGSFLFIEHVAAPDDSSLRFWQNLFDPLQQVVADGCHLTRNTLRYIQQAKFSAVDAENVTVANLAVWGPHIIGIAQA